MNHDKHEKGKDHEKKDGHKPNKTGTEKEQENAASAQRKQASQHEHQGTMRRRG